METIIKIIIIICGFIFGVLIGSLICWGLGNLIIWIFKINYTWTFLHGLGLYLIWLFLRDMFNNK